MDHSEACLKSQIKFENQINIPLLIREMDQIQSARQHVVHLCSNSHNTRGNFVTVTFPLPTVRKNCFKKLATLSLASVLPVHVMDQKRGHVITHGETNLSFLLAKST